MEKKIVVSKRFRKNTLNVYDYLIKEYSAKTAFNFLDKLQHRVELIIIRSVTLQPHNRIYYRIKNDKIELLCLFDMRRKRVPY